MQSETESVLKNLTIIANLSHNDKLNTNEDTFSIYIPTVMRGSMRTWYGEKRACNMTRIQNTVRMAISFIQTISQEFTQREETLGLFSFATKQKQCKRMYNSLEESKTGLGNLQQTYRDDITMHTQLKIVIDEIDDFISIISTQVNLPFLIDSPSPPASLNGDS
jgi:hypothetical protein